MTTPEQQATTAHAGAVTHLGQAYGETLATLQALLQSLALEEGMGFLCVGGR
jgi:hypothetical protein